MSSNQSATDNTWRFCLALCLLLCLATFALYWPVHSYGLISIDDPEYVTLNQNVKDGFTPSAIRAVFVASGGNWIPLVHLSHILDYALFGEAWGYHHLVSVAMHALATVLLFLFFVRATSSLWPSAFVAAIFALHPLHVESVAWISERKDVLCAVFWFLGLWLWVRYTERPSLTRYGLTLLALLLGIMSKPMIVSFPILLFILDYWPLRRTFSRRLILEKAPFFFLVLLCSAVTWWAQQSAGYVKSLSVFPLSLRLENAIVSLCFYLRDSFWPTALSFGYPYPTSIAPPVWLSALALLLLLTVGSLVLRRRRPWLLVGWFWFLATVAPVSGLIQVGAAARADRYMYIPMIGISLMLIWTLRELDSRIPRFLTLSAAVVACLVLAVTARAQLGWWSDSERLYRHSLAVEPDNYLTLGYLSMLLYPDQTRSDEVLALSERAALLRPDMPHLHENVSIIAARMGRFREALAAGEAAVSAGPADAEAWFVWGDASVAANNLPEAITRFERAIRLSPEHVSARLHLSRIFLKMGRLEEARSHLQAALKADPGDAGVQGTMGAVLLQLSGPAKAIPFLDEAVRLAPDEWESQQNLGYALANDPYRRFDAVSHLEESLRLNPENAVAHRILGGVLLREPQTRGLAIAHLEYSLKLQADPALAAQVERLRKRK